MSVIPSITYPTAFDSDDNLFLVHDGLRLRLAEDYTPGDTHITAEGDLLIMTRWPQKGILTLTEQCSDIEDRAISFFYDGIDTTTGVISNLQLLPGFPDVVKAKRITNVTINVTAPCHNNLKDALIAIENFVGVKGTEDDRPFGPTLEGRVNFLRRIALVPKAWFTADHRTGIVPLEVNFKNLSFRLGTDGNAGPVTILWDFGDNTTSVVSLISYIEETVEVPEDADNVYVYDMDGGSIKKTYLRPGIFDVTLTVTNKFGSDVVTFPNYINARIQAPHEAVIRFSPTSAQKLTDGVPSGGPYEVVPKIRSPINTLISLDVPSGENPATPGYSFGGELLNGSGRPVDPIETYTWAIADDLSHPNSSETKASFGVGGIYDLILRVDTKYGAYRITSYTDSIDIIENVNLWLWLFQDSTNVKSYEFGLISETFKLTASASLPVIRDSSFLDDLPEADRQIREFNRNVGFAPRGTLFSGRSGSAMLYWASGRGPSDPAATEKIYAAEYNGFNDTYLTRPSITRPWNWAFLNSPSVAYFAFGTTGSTPLPNTSPTNAVKVATDLINLTNTSTTLGNSNFENGAQELLSNPSIYSSTTGRSLYGDFSVYRTAWKDSTGYLARNDGVGPFFRIKSFYRTEGTVGSPFINIRKMLDIQGVTKSEGQMTDLSSGIYFFNNSGSVSAFNDLTSGWTTGGPGVNSIAYRALQDTSVEGFDDQTNTLLVSSDGDSRAYISFDYSPKAFIKFNGIDTTFKSLGARPSGTQWLMGTY